MNKIVAFFLLVLIIAPCAHAGFGKFWREAGRVGHQTSHGFGKVAHFVENKILEPTAHAIENSVLEPTTRTIENEVIEPAANGFNDHVIKPGFKAFSKGVHQEVTKEGEELGKTTVKVGVQLTAAYLNTMQSSTQESCDRKRKAESLPFEPAPKRLRKQ
jgi:hypothetical protein